MVAFSSCERNFPSCRIQVGNPARMRKTKKKNNNFPLLGGAMVAFSSCERNFPSCRIQVGNPARMRKTKKKKKKTTFLYLEGPWWHFPPANGIFLHAESKWETQRECGKPKKNKKKPKQNHFPLLGGAMVAFSSCER